MRSITTSRVTRRSASECTRGSSDSRTARAPISALPVSRTVSARPSKLDVAEKLASVICGTTGSPSVSWFANCALAMRTISSPSTSQSSDMSASAQIRARPSPDPSRRFALARMTCW